MSFPAALREGTEITVLAAPWAPGLILAFGRWRGAAPALSPLATGKGPSREAAIAGCLGEMAENLSIGAGPGPVRAVPFHGGPILRDARARDLSDPGDLGSEGCAAHPDPAEARLRALCERMERAALADWWRGQGPAPVPLAPGEAEAGMRQGNPGLRRSRAWRMESVPGIAAVLVLTDDGAGGRIALGAAAALSLPAARTAALAEAMLAEVAWIAPPAHPDHQRIARAQPQLAGRLGRLAAGMPAPADAGAAGERPGGSARLDQAVARLRAAGVAGGFADLTQPGLGLPVVRCLCPGLPSARGLPV